MFYFLKEDQMESLMMLTYGTVDNFIPFASTRYSFNFYVKGNIFNG